jgi:hypothetical protein
MPWTLLLRSTSSARRFTTGSRRFFATFREVLRLYPCARVDARHPPEVSNETISCSYCREGLESEHRVL